MTTHSRNRYAWRLQDILLMAVLGLIFAIVYMGAVQLGLVIQTALTPAGWGLLGFEIVYGIWFMAATLAAFIMRKPGVAFVTEFLAGTIELLLGNSGGMQVVLTALIQATGLELCFALHGYRRWGRAAMVTSAITGTLFSLAQYHFMGLFKGLDLKVIAICIVVRLTSALVFAAFGSEGLGRGLALTGVLNAFPIAQTTHSTAYADANDDRL